MKLSNFIIAGALLLSACSDNQATPLPTESSPTSSPAPTTVGDADEKIPEPLLKAFEQAESGNLERALTYIAMVENDFPDSKYKLDSLLLKGLVTASMAGGSLNLFFDIADGVSNMSAALTSEGDTAKIRKIVDSQESLIKEHIANLVPIVETLLEEYANSDKKTSIPEMYIETSAAVSTDFFARVGYPLPTEQELQESSESYLTSNFNYVVSETVKGSVINYVNFFHYVFTLFKISGEDVIIGSVANEILTLTESDKYNEKRLDAQEFLEEIPQ